MATEQVKRRYFSCDFCYPDVCIKLTKSFEDEAEQIIRRNLAA